MRGAATGGEAELGLLALRAAIRPETEGDLIDEFTRGHSARELNGAIWSRAVFGGDLSGAARLTRIALGAITSPEWQASFRVRLGYLAVAAQAACVTSMRPEQPSSEAP